MKLFVTFILFSLTPFILASGDYYTPTTTCKCVSRESCSYKFSALIEPRSPRYNCPGNLVCCKLEHIIPNDNEINYDDDNGDYSAPKPTYDHQPAKCGLRTKISAYKRVVVPAALAALGEFPWQAAILKNYTEGFVFVCGGVLVDKQAIVTTAHSVDRIRPENILVRLGENNVQADPKRRYHHVNARVDKILVKEDFNKDTLENDLAVLCLERKVKCNEVVSPICLPDVTSQIDSQRCVISGWGKGSYGGNYSSILRKAHINLVPSDQCQYLLRKRISDPSFVLDPSFVCAGGELGKDACTGDAGGPLSCPNKHNQQILTGIVSWGIGCGEKDVPGVYTDIRHTPSLNWINNAINICRSRNYKAPVEQYAQVNKPVAYNNPSVVPVVQTIVPAVVQPIRPANSEYQTNDVHGSYRPETQEYTNVPVVIKPNYQPEEKPTINVLNNNNHNNNNNNNNNHNNNNNNPNYVSSDYKVVEKVKTPIYNQNNVYDEGGI